MYFDIITASSSRLLFVHYGFHIIKIEIQPNLFYPGKMGKKIQGKTAFTSGLIMKQYT